MGKRRPYKYQDREWLEIANIREKIDVQGDEVPLSELDQPYLYGNDEDDNYLPYETDWPDPPPGGPYPVPDPVPIPGPCNQEGGCNFVTIANVPETIECNATHHFSSLHVVYGCEGASFEDAFLTWTITAGEILSPKGATEDSPAVGGVGMTWKAPDCCDGQEVVVCVSSIDGSCSDCRSFKLECGLCCEEFEIIGADTANPSSIWSGAITPPCPGAECTVSNNSGCPMECEVNPDGSTVTVGVGAKNCGSFTVTVTEDVSTQQKIEDECTAETATKTVRINGNGGGWQACGGGSFFLCNGPFCHCEFIDGERMWFIWIGAGIFCGQCLHRTCWDNYYQRPPLGNVVYSATYCAASCPDSIVPCAGGSLWGVSLFYWVNPDCECI